MGVSGKLGLGNHSVVLHPSLSALGLWFLGFACTVCPFQEGVKFGRVGVIKSRGRGLPWLLSGKKKNPPANEGDKGLTPGLGRSIRSMGKAQRIGHD